MRMRKRNNLEPRMEAASSVWIRDPEARRGQWRSLLPEAEALHLEIGCGKGKFTVEMAELHPEILFIAVERVKEALVLAMERPWPWVCGTSISSRWTRRSWSSSSPPGRWTGST